MVSQPALLELLVAEAGRFPGFRLERAVTVRDLELAFGRADALPGESIPTEAGVTPAGIMRLRVDRMRRLGLSGQKTAYIRELAKKK